MQAMVQVGELSCLHSVRRIEPCGEKATVNQAIRACRYCTGCSGDAKALRQDCGIHYEALKVKPKHII